MFRYIFKPFGRKTHTKNIFLLSDKKISPLSKEMVSGRALNHFLACGTKCFYFVLGDENIYLFFFCLGQFIYLFIYLF